MGGSARRVAAFVGSLTACTLFPGCGGTCACHGDVCTDCTGNTPATRPADAAAPGAADGAAGSALPDATQVGTDPTTDARSAGSIADTGRAGTDAEAPGMAMDSAVGGGPTVDSGADSAVANDGGAGCIPGCTRGTISCTAPDPPVGWRCTGPGIDGAPRFEAAGCSSVPINSIAWCCPATFLGECGCTPGQDSTCNDDPTISSLHGTCRPDHTCSCSIGPGLNLATGKCL